MAGNSRTAPPIEHPLVETEAGNVPTVPWILFFSSLFDGDQGTDWTPTFVGLTEVGAATFSGRYYQIASQLVYFRAVVTPGTNTSAIAGSTYIDNFPLTFNAGGAVFAIAGATGSNSGSIVPATQRIFVPSWTTVTVPVTIVGIAEAS